jgi:hypothetical protein
MRQPLEHEANASYNTSHSAIHLQSQVDRTYRQGWNDRLAGLPCKRGRDSIYLAGWKDAGKPVAAQEVA